MIGFFGFNKQDFITFKAFESIPGHLVFTEHCCRSVMCHRLFAVNIWQKKAVTPFFSLGASENLAPQIRSRLLCRARGTMQDLSGGKIKICHCCHPPPSTVSRPVCLHSCPKPTIWPPVCLASCKLASCPSWVATSPPLLPPPPLAASDSQPSPGRHG